MIHRRKWRGALGHRHKEMAWCSGAPSGPFVQTLHLGLCFSPSLCSRGTIFRLVLCSLSLSPDQDRRLNRLRPTTFCGCRLGLGSPSAYRRMPSAKSSSVTPSLRAQCTAVAPSPSTFTTSGYESSKKRIESKPTPVRRAISRTCEDLQPSRMMIGDFPMTSERVRESSTWIMSTHWRAHFGRCVREAKATGTSASASCTSARRAPRKRSSSSPQEERTPARPSSIGRNGGPARKRGRGQSVQSRSKTTSCGSGTGNPVIGRTTI